MSEIAVFRSKSPRQRVSFPAREFGKVLKDENGVPMGVPTIIFTDGCYRTDNETIIAFLRKHPQHADNAKNHGKAGDFWEEGQEAEELLARMAVRSASVPQGGFSEQDKKDIRTLEGYADSLAPPQMKEAMTVHDRIIKRFNVAGVQRIGNGSTLRKAKLAMNELLSLLEEQQITDERKGDS